MAQVRVEAALARPTGLLTRGQERLHLAGAQAMRALLRATLGDTGGALADIAAVRALPDAPAEALARAEVAEAIVLERAGDREALAAHLVAKRTLLLDATVPRERAVVRAYQRMLKATRSSVYRRIAPREAEPAGDETTVASFVARIAPAAAPFARSRRPTGEAPSSAPPPTPEEPIPPGLVRVAEARLQGGVVKRPPASPVKVVALWVLLIAMFVVVWEQVGSDAPAAVAVALASGFRRLDPGAMVGAAVLLGMAALFARIILALRHERRLAAATGALARSDRGAVAAIEALARSRHASASAQAHLQLAKLAERRGDLDEAQKRCDQGIAAATALASTRALTSSILLPDLIAERAFVLAATDRAAKAGAEMAVLRRSFPAYPFLARAELRVALVLRVRRDDLEGAARVADGHTDDLPLSLRDETLVDLVRALAHPEAAGAGEVERLKEELRLDPELRHWLEVVAPSVVRRFESSAPPPDDAAVEREAERDADAVRDEDAEREALAAEADATSSPSRRVPGPVG